MTEETDRHDIITQLQAHENAKESYYFNEYLRRRRSVTLTAATKTLLALLAVVAAFAFVALA